jgi:hypothetical protein
VNSNLDVHGFTQDITIEGACNMEIKDISLGVERLDEVRGGQTNTLVQSLKQHSGNVGVASASGWGVGNATSAGNQIIAPQSAVQQGVIDAHETHSAALTIDRSVIGLPFFL